MERKHAPHKRRLSEWTNPWLSAIAVALLLIGLPMVLWLMTYHSDIAVTIFVITWLSMTMIVLLMVKNSLTDPRYFVDRKVIDGTKQEIQAHRLVARKEMLRNEIETLQRGEKAPVLDVWRLDATLCKRHPYFAATKSLLIIPAQRELHLRVQIGEIGQSDDKKSLGDTLFKDIIAYFGIIARDPYLHMLRSFFDKIVLQIDSLREDERRIDTPFPILSLLIEASLVISVNSSVGTYKKRLFEIADIRFDEGKEIEPHRSIDLPSVEGL